MAGTFTLCIVTPEADVLNEEVEFAVLPGEMGELGILPRHSPLIAALKVGAISYTQEGTVKKVATSGGFAEISDNKATILAETAETAEMINLARALAAKERAEQRLAARAPETDIKRAELALLRAMNRISLKER